MTKITREQLIDPEDGENRAVRAFLLLYGDACGVTVVQMRDHMRRSGFPYWPDWAEAPGAMHLNKLGAQNWLRHLFALESSPEQPQAGQAALRTAAQAVLDRWNSPKWEWHKQGPTADLMADLSKALNGIDTSAERVEKGGADRHGAEERWDRELIRLAERVEAAGCRRGIERRPPSDYEPEVDALVAHARNHPHKEQ